MQPPQTPSPSVYPADNLTANVSGNGSALAGMILSIIALALNLLPIIGAIILANVPDNMSPFANILIVLYGTPLIIITGLSLAVIGTVSGHIGLNRARQLPPPISRRGMAITALVVGYLAIAIDVLIGALIVRVFIGLGNLH